MNTAASPDPFAQARRRSFGYDPDANAGAIPTLPGGQRLTLRFLSESIDRIGNDAVERRVESLQKDFAVSGRSYTALERDMVHRLARSADRARGAADLAQAGDMVGVVSQLARRNPGHELHDNQRHIAHALLDAIGSARHAPGQLVPIIDKFSALSLDANGFNETDAKQIRDMLAALKTRGQAGAVAPAPPSANPVGSASQPAPGRPAAPPSGTAQPAVPTPRPVPAPAPRPGTGPVAGASAHVAPPPPATVAPARAGFAATAALGIQAMVAGSVAGGHSQAHGRVDALAGSRVFTLGRGLGVPSSNFRFVSEAGRSTFALQQQTGGVGGWVSIKGGIAGDARVKTARSNEWEAGVGANATSTVQSGGDGPYRGSAGVYAEVERYDTLQVNAAAPPGRAADTFRVRLYGPGASVQGGVTGVEGGQGGAGGAATATLSLARIDYRWGRETTRDGVKGAPPRTRTLEWGVSARLNAGLDLAALVRTGGQPEALKALAAAAPAGSVGFHAWATGTGEIEAHAHAKDSEWSRPGTPGFKRLAGDMYRAVGALFDKWVVTGSASVTLGGAAGGLRQAREVALQPPASSSTGLLTEGQTNAALAAVTADLDGLMNHLAGPGLAAVAERAAPVLAAASAMSAVRALASRKGRDDFSFEALNPQQKAQLEDRVLAHAFNLALGESVPQSAGAAYHAHKGFTRAPGESTAAHAQRITRLIASKLPQAATDVLSNEAAFSGLGDLQGRDTRSQGERDRDRSTRRNGPGRDRHGNPLKDVDVKDWLSRKAWVEELAAKGLWELARKGLQTRPPAAAPGPAPALAPLQAPAQPAPPPPAPAIDVRAQVLARQRVAALKDLAAEVVRRGSKDDGHANLEEAVGGLRSVGYEITDRRAFEGVVARYGTTVKFTVTASELARAMLDGVVQVNADRSVSVKRPSFIGVMADGRTPLPSWF